FQTGFNISTDMGTARLVANMKGPKGREQYAANVNLNNFNVGRLIKMQPKLGRITAKATVTGTGLDAKKANAKLSAQVISAYYNKYTFRDLMLSGTYAGEKLNLKSSMADTNANFNLTAAVNMSGKYPAVKADLDLKQVDLQKLNFSPTEFRLAGLVTDAQHRLTKTGRQFGSLMIEDYSGKTEMMLWSDDYTRFAAYLEKGKNLFITGTFKPRFNKVDFEFKVERLVLLESIKQILTKQVILDIEARFVDEGLVNFLEKNVKSFPGKTGFKFNITDPKAQAKITMFTMETGFEMNDELAAYLYDKTELDVQVLTN
ncbi:MAG: hypothetical protein EOP48_30890, partial [Sphingobacteriales bacterium]